MELEDVSKWLREKVWMQGYASGILAMYFALQHENVDSVLKWVEYDFKPDFVDEKAPVVLNVSEKDVPLPPGCDGLPGGGK